MHSSRFLNKKCFPYLNFCEQSCSYYVLGRAAILKTRSWDNVGQFLTPCLEIRQLVNTAPTFPYSTRREGPGGFQLRAAMRSNSLNLTLRTEHSLPPGLLSLLLTLTRKGGGSSSPGCHLLVTITLWAVKGRVNVGDPGAAGSGRAPPTGTCSPEEDFHGRAQPAQLGEALT